MTDYLFPPTPAKTLPVSLHSDIIVDFKNRVPGSDPIAYTDYPGEISIDLIIGNIVAPAVISTYHAVCRVESTVADTITDGTLWACVVRVAGIPQSDDTVPINGTIERHDGDI